MNRHSAGTIASLNGGLLQSQAHSMLRTVVDATADSCTAWKTTDTGAPAANALDENDFPYWLLYVIAAVGMAIGLFNSFFGYKYWSVTCFFTCGYTCAVIVYQLTMSFGLATFGTHTTYVAYGIGAGAWIVFGIIFAKFPKLAAFVAGASLGVMGAMLAQPLFLAYIWKSNPNVIMYVLMVVLGGLGAYLAVKLERSIVITSTSAIGAFIFIVSLSTIVGNMPSLGDNQWAELAKEGIDCVPPYAWAYAGGIVFLMNLAIVVQYKVTAKNVDHGGFLNKTKKDEVPDNQQGLVPSNTQVRYV